MKSNQICLRFLTLNQKQAVLSLARECCGRGCNVDNRGNRSQGMLILLSCNGVPDKYLILLSCYGVPDAGWGRQRANSFESFTSQHSRIACILDKVWRHVRDAQQTCRACKQCFNKFILQSWNWCTARLIQQSLDCVDDMQKTGLVAIYFAGWPGQQDDYVKSNWPTRAEVWSFPEHAYC